MVNQHTLRVRENRWEAIKKKAWELSTKAQKVIKPTDVADVLLYMNIENVTLENIEEFKETR